MLTERLMALPEELRIKIIGEMVRINLRISLLVFAQDLETRCLPFKHHDHLLAIAEEQAIRNNVFYWPLAAPAVTLEAEHIRHLEMDLRLTINGGDVLFPRTFDIPTLDAAKLTAIPYFFPKLAALTINVDHTPVLSPGAYYVDHIGFVVPAAGFYEANVMEYCWKIGEILTRARELYFPRCRRDETLKRKVVFKQSMMTARKTMGKMDDPMEIKDLRLYWEKMYQTLESVESHVYIGEGAWDW